MGDRRTEEASFTEFVVARQTSLLRSAYLLTGDGPTAEDLVQQALTEAAVRWRKLDRDGHPEAYVRRVIYTRFVSGWRRKRVLNEVPSEELPDGEGKDFAEATTLRVALDQALAGLAPRQRACLVLRYYEDRSEAETAALLGCSVGTVKSQTHDAVRRLRAMAPQLSDLLSGLDSTTEGNPAEVAR